MKKALLTHLVGALAALAGNALYAQDIVGDWHGTLSLGPVEMRVQVHVAKSDKGYSGTLDSPDQGVNGVPADSVTLDGSTFKFAVGALQVTYEGKVSADGGSIAGTLTQGQPTTLDLTRGIFKPVVHKPGKPSDIDGAWNGTLDTPAGSMKIVFHIVNTEDGLTATADIPDRGATGLAVGNVSRQGQTLKMEMKQFGGGFEGSISPDLKTITGNFSVAGNAVPLVLKQ